MLTPLKITCAAIISTIPYNYTSLDYSAAPKVNSLVTMNVMEPEPPKNKNIMEYNTTTKQEYLDSIIEKSFYTPIINQLEQKAP
jgi:hypothetical protein